MPTRKMLDLSTLHADQGREEAGGNPDFGEVRFKTHEYGWIVFVDGGLDVEETDEKVPEWLRSAWDLAVGEGCILINYDSAGAEDPRLLSDLEQLARLNTPRLESPNA